MRYFFIIAILAAVFISCKSKSSTEKDSTKDTANIVAPTVDTATQTSSTVTKKLIYEGYEEGDYAHLVFKDSETGESYDFGHPEENNLGGIAIVIADTTTSFGYKENAKAKGTSYSVTMEKKMVNTYDGNGQPVRAEGWRIVNISQ